MSSINKLAKIHPVFLYHVRAHNGIGVNESCDILADIGLMLQEYAAGIGVVDKQTLNMDDVKKLVKKRISADRVSEITSARVPEESQIARLRRFYAGNLERCQDYLSDSNPRYMQLIINQLELDCCPRIHPAGTSFDEIKQGARCRFCREKGLDVDNSTCHYVLECPKYAEQRKRIVTQFLNKDIPQGASGPALSSCEGWSHSEEHSNRHKKGEREILQQLWKEKGHKTLVKYIHATLFPSSPTLRVPKMLSSIAEDPIPLDPENDKKQRLEDLDPLLANLDPSEGSYSINDLT